VAKAAGPPHVAAAPGRGEPPPGVERCRREHRRRIEEEGYRWEGGRKRRGLNVKRNIKRRGMDL